LVGGDARRLDVAVNDVVLVRHFQRFADLPCELEGFLTGSAQRFDRSASVSPSTSPPTGKREPLASSIS